jgi:hypothetical protein
MITHDDQPIAARSARRLVGHTVAAVLLAGVAVVATGGGAGAASSGADKPDSYGGQASAATVEYRVDRKPEQFPVSDPFHGWVPYAGTSIDSSGGASSVASSVYPGPGFLGVPDAICVLAAESPTNCGDLPGGGPPKYPDYATAQYPTHQDDSADLAQKPFPGTGPFEVVPNDVRAHADPNRVEATTVTLSSGFDKVLSVQHSSAHSLQTFKGDTLVMTADSVLKGVDIGGGVVHFDQIHSLATGQINGSGVSKGSAVTTVSGATVAGQAVTVNSTGIHVAGAGDHGQLQQAVNKALANLASRGIKIRSLGTQKLAKAHKVQAACNGLLLTFSRPVSLPTGKVPIIGSSQNGDYFGTITVGGAGVNAYASPSVPLGSVPLPSTPPVDAGTAGTTTPPATGGAPSGSEQTTGTPNGQQPAVADGGTPENAAMPTDLTNKRLRTLALVLLGYPLLMVIAAPFRAPSRLPRGG